MGRPKKIVAKTIKKTKKFEETVTTISTNDNNASRKYSRIQLQRNLESTYRNMYKNNNDRVESGNSHEYYSNTMSTYNASSYSTNKLKANTLNFSVPENTDYYNSYNYNGNRPIVDYHEESYLPFSANPAGYEGTRTGQDVPVYYSSTRQHALQDNRPLVIDTHTHVTISNYKVVSDTRMVVSDPCGSGSESPAGSESNDSVAGTHGSESNYDVEEDLDVILTSIQQSNEQQVQNNQNQNWQAQNTGIKTEFNISDVMPCRYPPQGQENTTNCRTSTVARDEQYWQPYQGYGYGTTSQYEDNFQSNSDQTVPYHEVDQYHTDSSPTPLGLGSHMYNSLLMAYNCTNYQDNLASDYYHGRQNVMMPVPQTSGLCT